MDERWLPVVGYEGIYDVSNCGRVCRIKAATNTWGGKILKGSVYHGYIRVNLSKENIQRIHSVHRLVTAAFLGNCPNGKQVNHIDGHKLNNAATNLEYVTPSENIIHAFRNGLSVAARGEANGRSVLTEDKVHSVRRCLGKESQASIARRLNVARKTISNIARGYTWAWLEEA